MLYPSFTSYSIANCKSYRYENGKICLSLLGTWHSEEKGEAWSTSSTVLQLLVSLMGLVLVKDPFYSKLYRSRFGGMI